MSKFKYYQCIKQVHAKPMTLGEFSTYSGKEFDPNVKADTEGYLVVYNKDTNDHYESWSPKDNFDVGYVEILPPDHNPH